MIVIIPDITINAGHLFIVATSPKLKPRLEFHQSRYRFHVPLIGIAEQVQRIVDALAFDLLDAVQSGPLIAGLQPRNSH
jgi:hypothetical protein